MCPGVCFSFFSRALAQLTTPANVDRSIADPHSQYSRLAYPRDTVLLPVQRLLPVLRLFEQLHGYVVSILSVANRFGIRRNIGLQS